MKDSKRLTAELVLRIALKEEPMPAVVPYIPSKTEVSDREKTTLHRVPPSRHGLPAEKLIAMFHALEAEPAARVHSIAVLRDGELVASAAAPGYGTDTYHLAHSMSKTLTGIGVGFLFDEKKLAPDMPLTEIFPDYTPADPLLRSVTIRHLLTMTSGIGVGEIGSVTSTRWTEDIFSAPLKFTPGEKFSYNSMNSYLLAHIIKRVTGEGLVRFLTPRLFRPLDITNVFWEKSPEGIEKGGWGAYLSVLSWAKIGAMLGNGGVWRGERILSADFVREATTASSENPNEESDFNYGYQLWVGRDGSEILLNGMLGQNVWIHPSSGTVVAMNSGNNELFHQSAALGIIRRHLRTDMREKDRSFFDFRKLKLAEKEFFSTRVPVKPLEPLQGIAYRLGWRERMPFPSSFTPLCGTYAFRRNNVGILPLFVRLMQNNYQGGLDSLTFTRQGEHLFLTAREGGLDYTYEIGLYGFAETIIDYTGERYLVRAVADAATDEGGKTVYHILFLYPELPDTRLLTLTPGVGGRLTVAFDEVPDQAIAEVYLNRLPEGNKKIQTAIAMLDGKFGRNFIGRTLERTFHPVLTGADTALPGWEKIVAEEEAGAAALHRTGDEMEALLNTFLPGDPSASSAPKKLLGLLGMFLSRDKGEKDTREKAKR